MTDQNAAPTSRQESPEGKAGRPNLIPFLVGWAQRRTLAFVLRRWLFLTAGFLFSAAAAVIVAKFFKTPVWEATATLAYAPLPIPDQFQLAYPSPELKSLLPMATSRPVMEALKKEFNIPIPEQKLANLFGVEIPPGSTDLVRIAFAAENRDQSPAIANRAAELFRHEVMRVRKAELRAYVDGLESDLALTKKELDQARKELREFARKHGVADSKDDVLSLTLEIAQLENTLATTKRHAVELEAQQKMLAEHIEHLKVQAEKDAKEKEQYEAAYESVADSRRRQDRLRELIEEERIIMEVQAQLSAKRREYERAKLLADKKLISKSRLERIEGEMETLKAKIKDTEKITKWQAELKRIDKAVVPKGKTKQTGSPIIAQVLFRKLELDMQILGGEKEIAQLEEDLKIKQDLLARTRAASHELAGLKDEIDAMKDQRITDENRLAILKTLMNLGPVEFTVVNPAVAEKYPLKSNAKILFILTLGGSFVVLAGLVALIDLLRNGILTPEDRFRLLGLDILTTLVLRDMPPEASPELPEPPGRAAAGSTNDSPDQLPPAADRTDTRRLALKIRQRLRQPGDILLLTAMGKKKDYGMILAKALAACLARRDEHVLIVNSRDHQIPDLTDQLVDKTSEPRELAALSLSESLQRPAAMEEAAPPPARYPGLSDLISFNVFDLDQAAVPSVIPGVDYLPFGGGGLLPEAFATHRMDDVLQEIRTRYTLTLLLGPPVSEEADLELLIPYASGTLFHMNSEDSPPETASAFLDDLYAISAPILGAVLLEHKEG